MYFKKMKQAEYQENQQWLHKIYEKNEPMLTLNRRLSCASQ